MKQHSLNQSSSSWLMLAICLACCWGASQLSEGLQRQLRVALLDSCFPYQEAKSAAKELWERHGMSTDDRLSRLESEYENERDFWESELRRRELVIAQLEARRQASQQPDASPFPIVQADSLIQYDVVSAGIIGTEQLRFVRRELLIESGKLTDAARDSLVIQATRDGNSDESNRLPDLFLDQGQDTGLEPELPVFAGRCVVGTLSDVGRWISRVRLLTDPEYRGRARILRQVEGGFVYGPEGILEGTGESLCRLRYLSRTESVRVGDRVYTSGPVPMYYGQIVRAELDEHAPEWNVWIQPAIDLAKVEGVQIMRQLVNPLRSMAN